MGNFRQARVKINIHSWSYEESIDRSIDVVSKFASIDWNNFLMYMQEGDEGQGILRQEPLLPSGAREGGRPLHRNNPHA